MKKIILTILISLTFILNESKAQNLSAYFYGDNKQDVVNKIKFLDSLSMKVKFIQLYFYSVNDTLFYDSIKTLLKNQYVIDSSICNNNILYCKFYKYDNSKLKFAIMIRNPKYEHYNETIMQKNIRLYNINGSEYRKDHIHYKIINNTITVNDKLFKFNDINDLYQIIKEK